MNRHVGSVFKLPFLFSSITFQTLKASLFLGMFYIVKFLLLFYLLSFGGCSVVWFFLCVCVCVCLFGGVCLLVGFFSPFS